DFEELLDDLIARLQKEIENSSADTAAVAPDNAIGRVSRMDSILSQEVAKAMVAAKQKRILDLHAARMRLDEGSFGTCAACFEDIEIERLEAAPETLLCQACSRAKP
ncbi:MAG: TraR/DksA C4-type zinc finger protein, partial [Prosthecobacter sp.]|nr:TraR/DksA C4-type zinc finger protein [Prosthecobacter sp.]